MKLFSNLIYSIFLVFSLFLFSGCWELMEADGVAGFADTAILADDVTYMEEGGLRINGEGHLIATNEISLNRLLGELELRRVPGERNPQLFIKGRPTSFGEVLSEENKVRIFEYNKAFAISNSIYSVEGETVQVRANAQITSNNVVGRVYKGNLVVTLSEENGWYQVKVVQNSRITYGWIEAKYLAPLIIGTPSGYDCLKGRTGNYTFINKSPYRCRLVLYPPNMPPEWIGNPGLSNLGQVTLNPDQSETLYNLKSDNYMYYITFKITSNNGDTYDYKSGQLHVETCQTLKFEIK